MKKPEDSDAFPKSNMTMTIQWQVLTMRTLKSLLYMLQCDERQASINMLSHNNAPKTAYFC